jgi:lysophospholipase L1-like esterase
LGGLADDLIAAKKEMYRTFRDRLPDAVLVVMSGLPCPERAELWGDIQKINDSLKDLCEANGKMIYADADALMTSPGGGFMPELFSDGVHLNKSGRAIWGELIKEKLAEAERMLGR